MKEYLEKYRDIFDLRLRIKEIDKNYELVFNKKTKQVKRLRLLTKWCIFYNDMYQG